MSVLVVGSLAYDSVESPEGSIQDALGGLRRMQALLVNFIWTV